MEAQRCIIIAPQLCGLITEGKDFQVAKVVFQVGGGFRADVVVNGIRRVLVRNAEGGQGAVDILAACSIIMDGKIKQAVEIDLQVAFQAGNVRQQAACVGRTSEA